MTMPTLPSQVPNLAPCSQQGEASSSQAMVQALGLKQAPAAPLLPLGAQAGAQIKSLGHATILRGGGLEASCVLPDGVGKMEGANELTAHMVAISRNVTGFTSHPLLSSGMTAAFLIIHDNAYIRGIIARCFQLRSGYHALQFYRSTDQNRKALNENMIYDTHSQRLTLCMTLPCADNAIILLV